MHNGNKDVTMFGLWKSQLQTTALLDTTFAGKSNLHAKIFKKQKTLFINGDKKTTKCRKRFTDKLKKTKYFANFALYTKRCLYD